MPTLAEAIEHPHPAHDSDAADRLIVALDFPSATSALDLVDRLDGTCRWFKVGMELYFSAGRSIVETLSRRGFHVFLDLKLHDIPNTVASSVRLLSAYGAELLTVHASGGEAMLSAAREAASAPGAPKLLAVTVLTSMDAETLATTGVAATPAEQVLRLALIARSAGIEGLVCSSEEVAAVHAAMGPGTTIVVPGIRQAAWTAIDDQRRTSSAGEAIRHGASKLVVGRPITRAADPARAAAGMLTEIGRQ